MRRLGLVPYIMTIPANTLVGLFILLPAACVLALSFMQSSYGLAVTFVGLENYTKLLYDHYFWRSALNTFIVVNAIVYLELLLALGLMGVMPPPGPLCRIIVSIIILPYAARSEQLADHGERVLRSIGHFRYGSLLFTHSPARAGVLPSEGRPSMSGLHGEVHLQGAL